MKSLNVREVMAALSLCDPEAEIQVDINSHEACDVATIVEEVHYKQDTYVKSDLAPPKMIVYLKPTGRDKRI